MKKFLPALLFSLTILLGGEISVSISENLVNEYLNLIGNYQIVTGKKDNQATWTIKNPRVKFQYGKAVFLTTILFKKGKTEIKKDYFSNNKMFAFRFSKMFHAILCNEYRIFCMYTTFSKFSRIWLRNASSVPSSTPKLFMKSSSSSGSFGFATSRTSTLNFAG